MPTNPVDYCMDFMNLSSHMRSAAPESKTCVCVCVWGGLHVLGEVVDISEAFARVFFNCKP